MNKPDKPQEMLALPCTLHCILYVSSEVFEFSDAALEHLVTRAKERNAEVGVTGILLHRDRCFMQYIEGPKDELERIYGIIKNDPAHSGFIEIIDEPIAARLFPECSMAFRTKTVQAFTPPDDYATLLQPRLKELLPDAPTTYIVLNTFWNL